MTASEPESAVAVLVALVAQKLAGEGMTVVDAKEKAVVVRSPGGREFMVGVQEVKR